MIQAVLAGKSCGYEYTEDILTSTIFGALKYLRPHLTLIPFIESAFLYNEKRTTLGQMLNAEGIELRCFSEVEYMFWPRNNTYGEPDLSLLFKSHIHGHEDFLLVIEAKFKSGKSGTEENDQLVRYYEAIINDIGNFSVPSISGFNGKKGYIVYITEAEAYSDIAASSKLIESKYKEINDHVFHLRWHQLYKTFETLKDFYPSTEKAIVEDLMKYLEKLGLRDFSGISFPTESLNEEFLLPGPMFYRGKLTDREKKTYFDELIFELNQEEIIFYRGN